MIAPLLAFGELTLGCPSSLNLRPVTIDRQIRLPRLTGVAPVSVYVRAGVGSIEHNVEMLTVVNAGGIGLDFPNQLVASVRIHRELVAKVTLAILFGPSGVRILLPTFRGFPVRWGGLLIDQYALLAGDMLLWSRDQGCIGDLTALGQLALPEQLAIQTIKESRRAARAVAILKVPHRRTVRDIGRHRQTAKALKAQSIQQLKLDLPIRQIVQSFKHQNPNHGLSRKGWATASGQNHSGGDAINLARQCRKVQDLTDHPSYRSSGPGTQQQTDHS